MPTINPKYYFVHIKLLTIVGFVAILAVAIIIILNPLGIIKVSKLASLESIPPCLDGFEFCNMAKQAGLAEELENGRGAAFIDIPPEIYYSFKDVTIESITHQERNHFGEKQFTKYEGDAFGLTDHNDFSVLEFFQTTSRGRGIASGDFNNDNWQDVVLATNEGVLLYENLGNYRFALRDINLSNIPNLDLGVHVVALVDIDNDGWQDIYITTYGGKNYFILNDTRGFRGPRLLEVPNTDAILTLATSFGDIDKDGDLDFVNGNWMILPTAVGMESNKLIINKNLDFIEEDLKEIRGQTLSVLFSDFNNDSNTDLIIGNEFASPDIFYTGDGEGGLRKIKKSDGTIPGSGHFTMSMDVADFNNDLYMDIYVSGISSFKIFKESSCPNIQNTIERERCKKNFRIISLVRGRNIETCKFLTDTRDKNECMAMIMLRLAIGQKDRDLCDKIPEEYRSQQLMCHTGFTSRSSSEDRGRSEQDIKQIPAQNVLLQGSRSGIFQEVAKEKNVNDGLNSWNAKFADLDNDEWQDIYAATGEIIEVTDIFQPNVFFHNYRGQHFDIDQESFGLENLGITPAYIYIDIDNDGDLDIIATAVNGPISVYINNEYQNNSITFEFRDMRGNYFGIGNKIYIYYGENNERHQVREIKSGGGFLSFDAPVAHFGLGKYGTISKVEITWSTGGKTILNKEFLANRNYVVTRSMPISKYKE